MQEALRTLPRRAAAAIALLILAAAACNDPLPTAVPPAVDTAELERATERVQAAADRLGGAAERLETAPESSALIINKDALRLLALLSQLQIELGIIDTIIDPLPYGALRRDSRPRQWPLEPEDGAALGFASSRLSRLELQLFELVRSLAKPLPTFDDDQILPTLVELQSELAWIGHSIYVLWDAHDDGNATPPSIPRTSGTRMQIARLTDSVGAFLATDHSGAALIPGAVWGAVNGLERLDWAARGNCFVWNCQGGHSYPWDLRRSALAVYSATEFRSASSEARGYSRDALDDTRCGRSVADGASALWQVSYLLSQYADQLQAADFEHPREGGRAPSLDSMASPIALYRYALLACTLSLARAERHP